ncbi:GNAT family N-acetyltransferase [Azotobacter chroococcum]|uniref:GNAT family N-acetyltransferase n=1 Tax=Azotobacter chroococcum TaxID=353 RepID=UPI000B77F793|nr:GNAT family N-acetyltransferase [Azotobacter chroococcum]TBW36189.1 GNAT family N-acetyltransferase [Azotobacter chroococcum]
MEEICEVTESQFERLTDVWEASVKATHDFLTEQDVLSLRSKVLNVYLAAVTLRAYKDEQGALQGFVGVSNGKVEMLFISPEYRGLGIGKLLLNYAINHLGATELDVNEQNPLAIAFYKHMGFKVIGRSLVDSLGNPFPLLHMKLEVSYK